MKDLATDLLALNERLRAGTIFFDTFEGKNESDDLYRNLEKFGLARSDVMIIGICPDGDDTVFGDLITRDGRSFTFDIDLADPRYSQIEGSRNASTKHPLHSQGVIDAAARWFEDH